MEKIFIWILSLIYIAGSSIWAHAEMMNNFSIEKSPDNNIINCDQPKPQGHHYSENHTHHQQCLNYIYIGYKVLSGLSLDILYKYKPIVFKYPLISTYFFENSLKINSSPIFHTDKQYLNFSDMTGIIIMLN